MRNTWILGKQRASPKVSQNGLISNFTDEGKLSTDQQVFLHAGAGTILPGFLAAIARFGVGREDFCHQRGMADDFSRSSSAWIATHGDIGADPGVFRQVQRDS